jgi:uncharacterized protein (TIGR02996 family)
MSTALDPQLVDLLTGVKDHPDDDRPRLVLADWLEENARSEAERAHVDFIRLQCRRARLGVDNPARKELEAQEQPLRQTHEAAWLGAWQALVMSTPGRPGWWFHRGLLRLTLAGTRWLDDLAADPAAWAWVDCLSLVGLGPAEVERVAACPGVGQLNCLQLAPQSPVGGTVAGTAGARALAASAHLYRLTALILFDSLIGPEGAEALAATPQLKGLTFLDLSGLDWGYPNEIGDQGARALARSIHLTGLRHLDLTENAINDAGAKALAGSANLVGLTHLNLKGNHLGPEGARALAESPYLARLTYLGLGGYGFLQAAAVHDAADALLSSPHLSNLARLDFAYPYSLQPDADEMEAFRQKFGNRLVFREG